MRSFIQVDPGDPHNDQMLASTEEDMADHMFLIHDVLMQGHATNAPLSALMAAIVIGLLENEDETRERLASLFALCMIKSYGSALHNEKVESDFSLYLRKLCGLA